MYHAIYPPHPIMNVTRIGIHLLFFSLGFLPQTFIIHRTAGEGEAISITPLYNFHPLHRYLDISRLLQKANLCT